MIEPEKSATPAFAGASIFLIMLWRRLPVTDDFAKAPSGAFLRAPPTQKS
jgi:hypothetical protein